MIKRIQILIALLIAATLVAQAQNVIFSEGFESATSTTYTSGSSSLSGLTGWSYSKTNYGRLRLAAGSGFYHTGSKAATMDDYNSSYTTDSWNQIFKTVDLSSYVGSSNLEFSFYYMDHGDETDANYDIVAIRTSSSGSWHTLYSLDPSNRTNGSWNYVVIDLDSFLKANSLTPTSTFQFQFGQWDEYEATSTTSTDGITFDDIKLTGSSFKGLNIALASIDSPLNWKSGNNYLTVSYQNRGKDTINYISLGYQLDTNKAVKVDSVHTGNLLKAASGQYRFSSPIKISSQKHDLKVWVNKPNGAVPDSNVKDDTLKYTIYTCLKDTFTIDSTGAGDFLSFTDAVSVLTKAGICGNTYFVATTGYYRERVEIPAIKGAGPNAQIYFIGSGSRATHLTYNGQSTAKRATVVLNGADYITFKNLSIDNYGTSYATGILFTNDASHNTVNDCAININSASNSYLLGINATNTESNINYTGANGFYNQIINNTFSGGYYGIYWTGRAQDTSNYLRVQNNEFTNQYGYSIYLYYGANNFLKSNYIHSQSYTSGIGIYSYYTSYDTIINNKINPGQYGIYTYYHNYSKATNTTQKSLFANNMISDFNNTTYNMGIMLYRYNYNINLYHNTIWVKGTSSSYSSNSALYAYYYPRYSNVKNNIFIAENSAFAISLYYPYNLSLDYNDYVYPSSGYHFYLNSSYTNLSSFKSNTSYITHDANSYDNTAPNLKSYTDLHLDISKTHNMTGTNVGLAFDFDDDYRNTSKPLLGADEVQLSGLNLAIAGIDSPAVWSAGKYNLRISLQNRGKDTINYYSLAYQVNSDPVVKADSVVKQILSGKTTTYTFGTKMNVVKGKNSIKIWCYKVNGALADSNSSDDTLATNKFTSLIDTYYIDKTGKGDFKSFTEAVSTMKSVGIAGSVYFIVKPGTYAERVEIPEITGAGKGKRIYFIGSSRTASVLTYSGTSATSRATLVFNGADYITFSNLTIKNTGSTYGTGVVLTGKATHNVIRGCDIDIYKGTNSYLIGINATGSESSQNTISYERNNQFLDNNISGGYYGICWTGENRDSNQYLNISGNTFTDQYYFGIYLYNISGSVIKSNKISKMSYTDGIGVYAYYTSMDSVINNIIQPGRYGIYYYYHNRSYSSASLQKSLIANNMISNFSNTSYNIGIYLYYYAYNINVFHNTVWVDGSYSSYSSNTALYAYYYPSYTQIINNIFIASNNAYAISLYYPYNLSLDYNDYVYPSSGYHFYKNRNYADLSAFKASNSYVTTDQNSFDNKDPYLNSKTDLHLDISKTRKLKGYKVSLDFDVDDEPRDVNNPTLGADELELKGLDISSAGRVGATTWSVGNNTLKARFVNMGKDTINYISVGYNIDTLSVKVDSLSTGTLLSGKTFDYTFSKAINLTKGKHQLTIWASKPNGVYPDSNILNDTFKATIYTALADTYYIDSSGLGDFVSFKEAVSALSTYGVAGDVVFIVRKGTYNEKIEITEVKGVNKTHKVYFVGEDRDRCVLTYSGTSTSDRATLILNGADYFEFNNLTIENTGTSYGVGMLLYNRAEHINVKNCQIALSTSATSSYLIGILVSNGESTNTSTGANAYHCSFDDNLMSGGYYGASVTGYNYDTAHYISFNRNEFTDQYQYSVYCHYMKGSKINQNRIHNMRYTGGIAVYMNYTELDSITGNIINPGQYGIYLYRNNYYLSSSTLTTKTLIANNTISDFNNLSYNLGIYMYYYNYHVNVVHNTIWAEGTYSSYNSNSCLYAYYYPRYSTIKNNIFIATNAAYAISLYYPYDLTLDYNDYYYPGASSYVFYLNTSYNNLYSFKANTSYITHDANSYDNKNPNLISQSDMHLDLSKQHSLFGDKTVGLAYDMDGDKRCTNNPYLGADEIPHDKELGLSDTLLDFEPSMQNFPDVLPLTIYNGRCSDTLKIYNIVASDTSFKPSATSAKIDPANAQTINVTFRSSKMKTYNEKLTVYANYDTVVVRLHTINQGRPEMTFIPDTLKLTVTSCNDSFQKKVYIKNTGNGPLNINLPKFSAAGVSNNTSGKAKILAYTYGSDLTTEYPNTLSAISAYYTNYTVTTTTTTTASVLANDLKGQDILLFPEQESGITSQYSSFAPVIRNFVKNGGTVIYCGSGSSYTDRVVSTGIITGSYYTSGGTVYAYNTTHPVGKGIASSWTGPSATFQLNITNSNAVKIAGTTYSDIVSVVPYGNGAAVYIGFDYYSHSTNEDLLISNAVKWAKSNSRMNNNWLRATQLNDTLKAGDSVAHTFTVVTNGMPEGVYQEKVGYTSNDPYHETDSFIVKLNLIGQPSISVTETKIDFGKIPQAYSNTYLLAIENKGCGSLDISSIYTNTTSFTASLASMKIKPFDIDTLYVSFSDTAVKKFQDTLYLVNNDTLVKLPLFGETYATPVIRMQPDTLRAVMKNCNDSINVSFTISNPGKANLNYSIPANKQGKVTGFTDPFNSTSINNSYWSYSTGVTVSSMCGMHSAPYALHFDGSSTREIRSNIVDTRNVDSIYFYLQAANGSTSCDLPESSDYLRVEYSTNGGTSWTIMYYCYYYNFYNMTRTAIALPTASKGQSVMFRFYQPYHSGTTDNWILDDVAIGKSSGWMSNPAMSGTVTPGSSRKLSVEFNSTGLSEGIYYQPLIINSNDPIKTKDTLWAKLDFRGDPQITISKKVFNFGQVLNYTFRTDSLKIENSGCGNLDISKISVASYAYTIWPDNLSLVPGSSAWVYVDFYPQYSGNYDDTIRIKGDIDTFIILKGEGANPPKISVTPKSINVTIRSCNDSVKSFVWVGNYGDADLIIKDVYDSIPGQSSGLLHDNFDNASLASWWGNTSGYQSSSCGVYNGSRALYFSTSSTRYIETDNLDARKLYEVSFYLKYGTGSSPCERLDSGEEVELYYSNNNGLNWTLIRTYNNATYSVFTKVTESIPSAARTASTKFKWQQRSFSGSGYDHWAMDEVNFTGQSKKSVKWLSVPQTQDTIAKNDSNKLFIWFNGIGLNQGTYNASIVIRTNDIINPSYAVPVKLTIITVPDIKVAANKVDMDSIPQLTTMFKNIYVANYGCDTLMVSKIYTNTSYFKANRSLFYVVPGDSVKVQLRFNPNTTGSFSDTLYIINNDSNLHIPLHGVGVKGPQIALSNHTFDKTLSNCYNIAIMPLTISNKGDVNLSWHIDASKVPSWITLSQYNGVVSTGLTGQVNIIYNVKSLTPGYYSVQLPLYSNDSSQSVVYLKCSVNVVSILGGVIELGNDTTMCYDPGFELDAGSGYFSYLWNSGQNNRKIKPKKSGAYSVMVSDQNGCLYADTINLTINNLPEVSMLINDSTQCLNDNHFVFRNQTTIVNDTLASSRWYIGSDDVFVNIDSFDYEFKYDNIYDIKLKVRSIKGCWDSLVRKVEVYPNPVVDLGTDSSIYEDQSLVIDAGSGFDKYDWSNGSTQQSVTVDGATAGPGTYTYWVQVANGYGCLASDTIVVTVLKGSSGIEDELYGKVKIYPNPSHKYFTVEQLNLHDATISLWSSEGKMLLDQKLTGEKTLVPVDQYAKGIYILRIAVDQKYYYRKILIR